MTALHNGMIGRFQFGAYELDLAAPELRRSGVRVRISRQLLSALGVLVAHHGTLIARKTLQDVLWPGSGRNVEASLNTAMNRLRRILRDCADRPLLIETVRQRGYRFIVPVQKIAATRANGSPPNPVAREAFLVGRHLTWSTLTAADLHAAVECLEQAIAADPHFASAHAGLALACQLLGAAGVDALPVVKLLPRAKAAARTAIELDGELPDGYATLGLIQMEFEGDLASAAGNFSRALTLCPSHVEAHVWSSQFHALNGQVASALDLARRALHLDPASPFAAANLVFLTLVADQRAEALSHAARMRRLHPRYWLGQSLAGSALLANGLLNAGLRLLEGAVELAPESVAARSRLGAAYALCGQAGPARQVLAHLEHRAAEAPVPALILARIYAALGEKKRCADLLQRARSENEAELLWLSVDPSLRLLRE